MHLEISRRQLLIFGLVVLAVFALAGSRLVRTGAARQQSPAQALRPVGSGTAPASSRVVVDVVGAVRRPGLYRLREGARIADAVERAGGATRRAEIALVNLAAPVVDGMQVVIPMHGGGVGGETGGAATPGLPAARVSLSSATVAQLDTLPGIGPVTAQKIVDWRGAHGPFGSVDALDAVPGIGTARIEQLRDLVTP